MGRKADLYTPTQYRIFQTYAGYKNGCAFCKHCGKGGTINVNRMKLHLVDCSLYQQFLATQTAERAAKKRKIDTGEAEPTQVTLSDRLSPTRQAQADELAALMIYQAGLPFNFFEKPEVLAFLRSINSAYVPPKRSCLATTMLDTTWQAVKDKVDTEIDKEDQLNVCFDGSSNINHQRICNISVTTKKGAFYYHNTALGPDTAGAVYTADKVTEALNIVTRNRLSRINSISADTCSTMLGSFDQISSRPGLEHCFFIPCDPHGLQLLIKDILSYPVYAITVHAASQIIDHFHHADKQYQIFKEIQQRFPGKNHVLVGAAFTRWGSHTRSFQRIIENIGALRVWAQDPRITPELKGSQRAIAVAYTLSDPLFLPKLIELERIISPISAAIIQAQNDHAHLACVRPRWAKIDQHLRLMEQASAENWDALWPVIEARWCRQLLDIHDLAFWLLPATVRDRVQFCEGTLISLLYNHY
jgi:hypothetical protein